MALTKFLKFNAYGLPQQSPSFADNLRYNVFLSGPYDGVGVLYTLPPGDKYVQDPPGAQIVVHHGTRRMMPDDEYTAEESVLGAGYDSVRLKFPPQPTAKVYADYLLDT